MSNLLRIKALVLITIISTLIGTSNLAWCLHHGGDDTDHVVTSKAAHGEVHDHTQEINPEQEIIVTSCQKQCHDCVHISISHQTLTSAHGASIDRATSSSIQPVPFQGADRLISLSTAHRLFRPSPRAVPPINQQLASLQTVVLLN